MKKDSGIKVLVIDPLALPRQETIPNTLKGMQKVVGGYIQAISPFGDNTVLICNEDGLNMGLPFNRIVEEHAIVGTFFICATDDEDGEFASLSDSQIELYEELFSTLDVFVVDFSYDGECDE